MREKFMILIFTMFSIIPRWCWYILAIPLIFIFGEMHGRQSINKKWDSEKLKEKIVIEENKKQQERITRNTSVKYVYVDRIIRSTGVSIIKKVPVYVTVKNNAQCVVNRGFVSVWNSANTGLQLSDTASATNDENSAVVLSDIATQHATESTYTRSIENKLNSLQDWVTSQQEASLIPVSTKE